MNTANNTLTIGFTKTTADHFFSRLTKANVKNLFDVRLNTTSQLSGFAKSTDLPFFLKKLCNIHYFHQPLLAPTNDILKAFKRDKGDWYEYQNKFLNLMQNRKIEEKFKPLQFENTCLLCSEAEPHHCHRKLVCDYLNEKWDNKLKIIHL